MKEIARLSGISVATVSRVINNNGRFSEETRRKVIEKTGYQPNSSAKSLRMNKTFSIGILVPNITNAFSLAKVVQKIEKILFMKACSTIICNTARDNKKKKLTSSLFSLFNEFITMPYLPSISCLNEKTPLKESKNIPINIFIIHTHKVNEWQIITN